MSATTDEAASRRSACERCGAQPGERCRRSSRSTHSHAVRYWTAVKDGRIYRPGVDVDKMLHRARANI